MITMEFDTYCQNHSDDRPDIAIIGAGISGLYAAWRLIREDKAQNITIYERLNRTGGRLDTDKVEVAEHQVVREEEGGMRFNYGMIELMNLFGELGLCEDIVDFPMGSANDTNRYFIRGHNFTVQDAIDSDQMIWSELFDLKPQEKGLSPTSLVVGAFNQIMLANGKMPASGEQPEFWAEFRNSYKWKGKLLREWQTWGLLRDMGYSEECITMLTQTIGFAGPFKGNGNAGDAFQILADFPKDPTYYTFVDGFSTLPNAIVKDLHENFKDRVRIVLSTHVNGITEQDGKLRLSLSKARKYQNAVADGPDEASLITDADHVIVACASQSMKELFVRSPALNTASNASQLWEDLNTVVGMRLQKINLYFDFPWWENGVTGRPSVQFGPSFTDLPINSAYPFYALPVGNDADTDSVPDIRSDAAAALTLYLDYTKTDFWNGLQNVGPMFGSKLQDEENTKEPQRMYPASRAVVDQAKEQLSLLFGTNVVPEPVLTSYRLWDDSEDFPYAYHQWGLNADDISIRDRLKNPVPNFYFCNEAISDMQGWVMGSLRSTDDMLSCFGIDKMSHKHACVGPKKDEQDSAGLMSGNDTLNIHVSGGRLWGL